MRKQVGGGKTKRKRSEKKRRRVDRHPHQWRPLTYLKRANVSDQKNMGEGRGDGAHTVLNDGLSIHAFQKARTFLPTLTLAPFSVTAPPAPCPPICLSSESSPAGVGPPWERN